MFVVIGHCRECGAGVETLKNFKNYTHPPLLYKQECCKGQVSFLKIEDKT